MDADVGHLERFTEVPYVIEAPASRGGMIRSAAAAALAKPGLRVRTDASRGLPPERYRAMIENVRADLEANLRKTPDYRISLVDLSRPDLGKELARIDDDFRGEGKGVANLAHARGAFASVFPHKGKGICLVVGLAPGFEMKRFLDIGTGKAGMARGGLDAETFHKLVVTHEVGHCLLGLSEAKADAFMALMALRDPAFPKETLQAWATWREQTEWTTPLTADNHFTAKSLWAVLERADALRADPAFRAMDIEGIAGLAKAIVEERGLRPGEEEEVSAVRRGIRAAVALVAPRAGREEGAMPLLPWLRAHADVPALARVAAVLDAAVSGARPMRPFEARPGELRAAVARLAAGGDRIAAAVASGFDQAPDTTSEHAHAVAANQVGKANFGLVPYKLERTEFHARALALAPPPEPEEPPSHPAPGR